MADAMVAQLVDKKGRNWAIVPAASKAASMGLLLDFEWVVWSAE
jgi:hypothetical protein